MKITLSSPKISCECESIKLFILFLPTNLRLLSIKFKTADLEGLLYDAYFWAIYIVNRFKFLFALEKFY